MIGLSSPVLPTTHLSYHPWTPLGHTHTCIVTLCTCRYILHTHAFASRLIHLQMSYHSSAHLFYALHTFKGTHTPASLFFVRAGIYNTHMILFHFLSSYRCHITVLNTCPICYTPSQTSTHLHYTHYTPTHIHSITLHLLSSTCRCYIIVLHTCSIAYTPSQASTHMHTLHTPTHIHSITPHLLSQTYHTSPTHMKASNLS